VAAAAVVVLGLLDCGGTVKPTPRGLGSFALVVGVSGL
jgi:hypothetical protein